MTKKQGKATGSEGTKRGGSGGAAVAEPPVAVDGTVEFQVGDVVHFYDRARYVASVEKDQAPKPVAAIITRVGDDGTVSLTILDPDIGHLPKRNVPFSAEPAADHWTLKSHGRGPVASVSATELAQAMKPLIDAAVAEQLEAALPKMDEAETEPA